MHALLTQLSDIGLTPQFYGFEEEKDGNLLILYELKQNSCILEEFDCDLQTLLPEQEVQAFSPKQYASVVEDPTFTKRLAHLFTTLYDLGIYHNDLGRNNILIQFTGYDYELFIIDTFETLIKYDDSSALASDLGRSFGYTLGSVLLEGDFQYSLVVEIGRRYKLELRTINDVPNGYFSVEQIKELIQQVFVEENLSHRLDKRILDIIARGIISTDGDIIEDIRALSLDK